MEFSNPKIVDLSAEYVSWEGIKSELETRRPKLLAQILELQEADLAGRPDLKALAVARRELADLDEKIQAATLKLSRLETELRAEVSAECENQYRQITGLNAAVADTRREAARELGRALAILEFFQSGVDGVFYGGAVISFQVGGRLGSLSEPEYLKEVLAEVRRVASSERDRLAEAYPQVPGFNALVNKINFLKEFWHDPEPLSLAALRTNPALLVRGPRGEAAREPRLKIFVARAISAARERLGVEPPAPKGWQGSDTLHGCPIAVGNKN